MKGHIFVDKKSSIVNQYIGDLRVESETGTRIIAVNRGKRWIYGVDKNFKFKAKDRLIVRGVEDGLEEFITYASGSERWPDLKKRRAKDTGGVC